MGRYSAFQASEITGADYHNILYWVRTGLIRPSESPNRQARPRHPVLFSFTDLLEIKIVQELRSRGASVQKIRKALDYVRSLGEEYLSLFHLGAALPSDLRRRAVYLDVTGDDIHLYHSDKEVISAVKQQGQAIIHALIIDFRRLREDVEQRASKSAQRVPATT